MKEKIFDTIDGLVLDFLYYDRKEDKDLPHEAIDAAINNGDITIEDICERFLDQLKSGLDT